MLIDLTLYEYKPLVRSALGLLVRHFEQRRELHTAAEKVQLLIQVLRPPTAKLARAPPPRRSQARMMQVLTHPTPPLPPIFASPTQPKMVENYALFDEMLRSINRLSAAKTMAEVELYEATWLLGELTVFCYQFGDRSSSARYSHRNAPHRASPSLARHPPPPPLPPAMAALRTPRASSHSLSPHPSTSLANLSKGARGRRLPRDSRRPRVRRRPPLTHAPRLPPSSFESAAQLDVTQIRRHRRRCDGEWRWRHRTRQPCDQRRRRHDCPAACVRTVVGITIASLARLASMRMP